MLVHQYKLFKMLQNESITAIFTKMIVITKSLDALIRTYYVFTEDLGSKGDDYLKSQ